MGILTEDMKRVVREQRLGFVATVAPDGRPSLSPKGTTAVWDDDHLVFADIHSPGTVANLERNPAIEINVVDPLSRKGYRFAGTATVLSDGAEFEKARQFYEKGGTKSLVRHAVLVRVERAAPIVSPAYDRGMTEAQVREQWQRYWDTVKAGRPKGPESE